MNRNESKIKKTAGAGHFLSYLCISAVALLMMYPLLWLIRSSFSEEFYIFRDSGFLPSHFTVENYIEGWHFSTNYSFARFFVNTLIMVAFVIIGNIISCSLAAYAFARIQFSLKKFFFPLVFFGMMLPNHVLIIPRYIMFNSFGWVDTYMPMVIPKYLATEGFFVYLLIQFMRGIPSELNQAATVDGCGNFQIYYRIILPMTVPAIATVAIFSFIWTWNDFLTQLIYISSPRLQTISVALRGFIDLTSDSAYGQLFAMSLLSLLPIMSFFVFFQKYLVEGIATTGLKG
jgi:multiple sugar transport system permease protein